MPRVNKKDIIQVKITGIQKYGAFASVGDDDYKGLIHISEISYGYVKDVHDFVSVGDNIYAEVIQVDDYDKKIKQHNRYKLFWEIIIYFHITRRIIIIDT